VGGADGVSDRADRLAGLLLGTAVGDALGLPREGLSARRARRLFGGPPLTHRLFLGRGLTSDDTEHACLVGQALLRAPRDADAFARSLGWGLRWWLLGLPAGIGRATLRATLKLWAGWPPGRSGVRSAGNGPAMRAPLLGACLGDDLDRLRAFVRASTRLTHTDPRAENGALLVALAARHAVRGSSPDFQTLFAAARELSPALDAELLGLLDRLEPLLSRGADGTEAAAALGLGDGVSGYIYHTVPLALYCWLRRPDDFRGAVEDVILLGGDTDTTASITGALAGATVGGGGIPADWLGGLAEWPRSTAWLRRLAGRLARQFPGGSIPDALGALPLFWPGLVPRNLFFLALVLVHALRRLLPPY
jgi:ADP-ribosylglycohydrolase